MAWAYELSIECGERQDPAFAVAGHFKRLTLRFHDGLQVVPWVTVERDEEKNWWVLAGAPGAVTGGYRSDAEMRRADRLTELGYLLLKHLQAAPRFRYAAVGVETEIFRLFSKIDQDLVTLDFHGVVISDDIWVRLGSPDIYEPFAPGYRYRPYRGEDQGL